MARKDPPHKAKPSSGGRRKYGRNKVKCARYRAEGRREKNKARRQRGDSTSR